MRLSLLLISLFIVSPCLAEPKPFPGKTSKWEGFVRHAENSEVVHDRYKKLGGPVERIVKAGGDHHPHGLKEPRPIVDFLNRAWAERK